MIEKNNLDALQDEFLNSENIENEFDNKLLDYALHYARIGYSVFPLHNVVREIIEGIEILRCSCKEWHSCKNQGKHPRTLNGLKDATTDENKIIDWWENFPAANIGLLTGIETGIIVLDIDRRYGGEYSLEALQDYYRTAFNSSDEFESLPGTLTTISGSGGRHLYFKYPLNYINIRNSVSRIGDGLDIRANNGYIIAPPSNHLNGGEYLWHGVRTPIEDAPNWLIYEILKTSENVELQVKASISATAKDSKKIKVGYRNRYLFGQACGLVNSFPKKEVLRRCVKKNNEDLVESLTEAEVKGIVGSAFRNCARYKSKNIALEK